MNEASLRLPQQDGGWFLTDGGIETVLIFQEGIALPEFAAFVLLESTEGRASLQRYFRRYLDLAAATPNAGFILESPTWRAGFDCDRRHTNNPSNLVGSMRCIHRSTNARRASGYDSETTPS